MKKPSPTELKKAPAAKGQAETKPSEVTELGELDEKTPALRSPPEPSANQPTPTELSQMTIALAQARRTPITEKNRDELLHGAYEMWEAADKLIQERQANAAREAAGREKERRKHLFQSVWGKRGTITIALKEIADQRLLPKRVGKKGEGFNEPEFVTSEEGVEKAFRRFHKSVREKWEMLPVGESISFEPVDLLFNDEPAAVVLETGAMSKALFEKFLAWKKRGTRSRKEE